MKLSWIVSVHLGDYRCVQVIHMSGNNWVINSLAPGIFEWILVQVIFKLISVIDGWGFSCETAVIKVPGP